MKIQKKKNWWIFLSVLTVFALAVACNNDSDTVSMGNWTRMSDFDGLPRCDAVAFSIGKMGYVGTGYDGDDRLKDFWEYNTEKDYWVQKADFPGVARNGAVAFTVGSMGYVGTGYDGDNKLKDFYQFDPATNKWTQKDDFPGTARYGATGFGLDVKGYLGAGFDDNYLKDFFEYDPSNNTWTKIVSIGGQKRRDATSFVINNKGYVVSGLDNGSYLTDLYMYDPAKGEWTKMRAISDVSDDSYDDDYTNIARISATAFTVNGKAYFTLGSSSSLLNTLWEYNPTTDLWKELTAFEGTIRTEAVGFGVGNYGYVATGRSNSYYLEDIWRLDPTQEYDEDN
jgi:N-acetylneuraminic acid mutarotase